MDDDDTVEIGKTGQNCRVNYVTANKHGCDGHLLYTGESNRCKSVHIFLNKTIISVSSELSSPTL